jgi:NADH:ubiquinone oxidoreductase subunit F (NADH-binding)
MTMTESDRPAAAHDVVRERSWTIGTPRLTAGLDRWARLTLGEHLHVHGALPQLRRGQLEELTDQVRLLGRGGAAFPVAAKLRALPARHVRAVVVNGAESEPASGKDRMLLRRVPHLVLDGADVVARAVGAREIVVVVHDEAAEESVRRAIVERGTSRISVVPLPGRFVSGEARAVIKAAEGLPAVPHGRRTLPTDQGLFGGPTFLSNTETYAQLAVLARLGHAYADTGVSVEPGTTLVALGGSMANPGIVEIPTGMPLAVLLQAAGVAPDAHILLGGYHGMFVPDVHDIILSRPDLKSRGLSLGAGVVLAVSQRTCALAEVEAAMTYLAAESAGQCGPCVFGLPSLVDDLRRLRHGTHHAGVDLNRHLGVIPGRGACAHPDGATRFVRSALHALSAEVQLHASGRGCGRPYRGELPLPAPERSR